MDTTEHKKPAKKPQKSRSIEELVWIEAGNGQFALRGKPAANVIRQLPSLSVTHVITLQGEREGSQLTGKHVTENNMGWINIPLENGSIRDIKNLEKILMIFEKMKEIATILLQNGKILIHCAAGLHRTGMMANLLLLFLGYDIETAFNKVKQAREITSREVGMQRRLYGEKFVLLCGTFESPKSHEHITENFPKFDFPPDKRPKERIGTKYAEILKERKKQQRVEVDETEIHKQTQSDEQILTPTSQPEKNKNKENTEVPEEAPQTESSTVESKKDNNNKENTEVSEEAPQTESSTVVSTCVNCREHPRQMIIIDCSHSCLCSECAAHAKLKDCPLCRGPITRFEKLLTP